MKQVGSPCPRARALIGSPNFTPECLEYRKTFCIGSHLWPRHQIWSSSYITEMAQPDRGSTRAVLSRPGPLGRPPEPHHGPDPGICRNAARRRSPCTRAPAHTAARLRPQPHLCGSLALAPGVPAWVHGVASAMCALKTPFWPTRPRQPRTGKHEELRGKVRFERQKDPRSPRGRNPTSSDDPGAYVRFFYSPIPPIPV